MIDPPSRRPDCHRVEPRSMLLDLTCLSMDRANDKPHAPQIERISISIEIANGIFSNNFYLDLKIVFFSISLQSLQSYASSITQTLNCTNAQLTNYNKSVAVDLKDPDHVLTFIKLTYYVLNEH